MCSFGFHRTVTIASIVCIPIGQWLPHSYTRSFYDFRAMGRVLDVCLRKFINSELPNSPDLKGRSDPAKILNRKAFVMEIDGLFDDLDFIKKIRSKMYGAN